MKELVIPDIHDSIDATQRIIDQEKPDHITFLGDWFDSWTGDVQAARRTAELAKQYLHDPNATCLLGNHDMSYGWGHLDGSFMCSGFTWSKREAIWDVLDAKDFECFQLHRWVEDAEGRPWLLSHAGFHPSYMKPIVGDGPNTRAAIDMVCDDALRKLHLGLWHPLFAAGRSRGGPARFGGINWLDWQYEFEPIEGINQLVGHTPGHQVRTKGQINLCVDTELAHYAIFEDGQLLVRSS